MLRCIVIEDQYPAQQILQKFIGENKNLNLVKTFVNTIEAGEFLKENAVDLIFLDINLPQESGMDFLRQNRQLPPTILTTAFSEFALESYEYNIVDYLLKPFSLDRFNQAITKALAFTNTVAESKESVNYDSGEEIFIKCGHEIVKLKSQEILFIKSDGDYTEVITSTKKYLSYCSLKDWLNKLDKDFCQVHKSYIINMVHLGKIASNTAHLSGKNQIPIGRAYKKGFLERKVGL